MASVGINLEKIKPVIGHRREGNLQIGYEIISEPLDEKERGMVKQIKEESQDLTIFFTTDGKFDPIQKKRIIEKFASPFAQKHMKHVMETGFSGYIYAHDDGTHFIMMTDFVLGEDRMDQQAAKVEEIMKKCQKNNNNGKISVMIDEDESELHEKEAFMYFLEKKFVVLNPGRAEGTALSLIDRTLYDSRNAFFNSFLGTTEFGN